MARRETHLPRKLVGLSPSDLKRMLNQWPTLPIKLHFGVL